MTVETVSITMSITEAAAVAVALQAYPDYALPGILADPQNSGARTIAALMVIPEMVSVLDRIDLTMHAEGLPNMLNGEVNNFPEGFDPDKPFG